jgi:hypothetical protein
MLATVDGSKDQRTLVENVTVQLAGVSKLKDALANLGDRTVNLIEEQHNRLITSSPKPVGRTKGGNPVKKLRKTHKVALSHLRGSTLNNRQPLGLSILINNAGLANTVATSEEDRLTDISNKIDYSVKSFKINSHFSLSILSGGGGLSTELT